MVTRIGTSASARINGTNSADVLYGRGGNDTLLGLAAADRLYGELGNDLLKGGSGTTASTAVPGQIARPGTTMAGPGESRLICPAVLPSSGSETDTLLSIENVTGTIYANVYLVTIVPTTCVVLAAPTLCMV